MSTGSSKSMYSREDFAIDDFGDFFSFLVVAPFVGLVAPFLIASYTLGFFLNLVGWNDT